MKVLEHAHYFEISSALLTIILIGKYLEQYSKKKTVDKLSELATLSVTKAILTESLDGKQIDFSTSEKEIDVELLAVGDCVKVYTGQVVPIDGEVFLGNGLCNESMLTGESRPIPKEIGSKVYGGSTLT
jgi:Cu+-exporting ATPase